MTTGINGNGELRHLSDMNRDEKQAEEKDTNAVQKIFGHQHRMALEKVNYWGDMRKGIKDKLERINNITGSNVHG